MLSESFEFIVTASEAARALDAIKFPSTFIISFIESSWLVVIACVVFKPPVTVTSPDGGSILFVLTPSS